jgi:hypothetical protein
MYLLRNPITWFTMVDTSVRSINKAKTSRHWAIMQDQMGLANFKLLHSGLQQAGLVSGKGSSAKCRPGGV